LLHAGSPNWLSHASASDLVTIARISTVEAGDIIEHSGPADPKPISRPANATQALDATSAYLCRLMPQMDFKRTPHSGSNVGLQRPQIFDSLRTQDDVVRHCCSDIADWREPAYSSSAKAWAGRAAGEMRAFIERKKNLPGIRRSGKSVMRDHRPAVGCGGVQLGAAGRRCRFA
jgi:hypothetical protein